MNAAPVVFVNPITGMVDVMPMEMITAYVPHMTIGAQDKFGFEVQTIDLQDAARVAAIRDTDAANELLLSIFDIPTLSTPYPIAEGNELMSPA